MTEYPNKRLLHTVVTVALWAALILLGFKYLLPWLAPFLAALLLARALEPVIAFLGRKFGIKRGYAAVMCSAATLLSLGVFIFLALRRSLRELSAFIGELPEMLSGISGAAASLSERIYGFVIAAPPEIQEYLNSALDNMTASAAGLPGKLTEKLASLIPPIFTNAPVIILSICAFAMSLVFMSAGFPEIKAFILRQIPGGKHNAVRDVKGSLFGALGKWAKAQLILCGITFAELTAAFLLLGIDYAVLLALLVAVIDMLPILGTGTVLIPWAVVTLITGAPLRALAIGVVYAVVSLVRGCVEPKLVGAQLGLHPAATLMSMYVGFRAVGVAGMLLAPLALITAKQLNDAGSIKLWR